MNITRQPTNWCEKFAALPSSNGAYIVLAIVVCGCALGVTLNWYNYREIKKQQQTITQLQEELAKYRTETVIEHNVKIIRQLADGDFAYVSDEKPKGDTYRPCHVDAENGLDVNGMLSQAVGHTADFASWEERGICRSILRADLEFVWRDIANNFTYGRQTNVSQSTVRRRKVRPTE